MKKEKKYTEAYRCETNFINLESSVFPGDGEFLFDYWVMGTDYENYAFCYGCGLLNDNGTCKEPHAWIWSRSKQLDSQYNSTVQDLVDSVCMVYGTDFIAVPQVNNDSCLDQPSPNVAAPIQDLGLASLAVMFLSLTYICHF